MTNALGMAIDSRRPAAGAITHSDQGVQFESWAFTDRAKASGLVPSMGRGGSVYILVHERGHICCDHKNCRDLSRAQRDRTLLRALRA